jgi:hypothetical protein
MVDERLVDTRGTVIGLFVPGLRDTPGMDTSAFASALNFLLRRL